MECKNCNQEWYGEQKFCSNCGQKNISKLNLKYLFGEILDNVLNLDSKMFSTVKYLLFKPGFLTKEFTEGRRARYVSPVKFYLITSLIFFVIVSIVKLIPEENINTGTQEEETLSVNDAATSTYSYTLIDGTITKTDGVNQEAAPVDTTEMSKDRYFKLKEAGELDSYMADSLDYDDKFTRYLMKKIYRNQYEEVDIGDEMLDQLSIFLLLFIPLMAFVYKLSFIRNSYNYINHIVFNIHFNSFVIVVLGINEFLKLIMRDWYDATYAILIIFIVVIGYLFIAIRKFYERKRWVTFYKLFVLFIGYVVLALVFAFLLLIVSVITN